MAFRRDEPGFQYAAIKSPLQDRLDTFLSLLNRKGFVNLEVLQAPKYPAGAQGFCVLNHAFGQIQVGKTLTESLTKQELDFVFVHELTHIVENHLIWRSLADLPQSYLDAASATDEDAKLVNMLVYAAKAVLVICKQLPPEAALTKAQEIGADVQSICLTGNILAAISTLTKLVGNDLEQPSHTWEFLGVNLPMMTMRERINEIQRSLQQLRMYGFTSF